MALMGAVLSLLMVLMEWCRVKVVFGALLVTYGALVQVGEVRLVMGTGMFGLEGVESGGQGGIIVMSGREMYWSEYRTDVPSEFNEHIFGEVYHASEKRESF